MCRMLACITTNGLPDGLLEEFRRLSHEGRVPPEMAPGHVSGWGIYASDFVGSALHYRSGRDAWDDSSFGAVMEAAESLSAPRSLLVHLRKASVGRPRPVNSHPFVVDGKAFMHNGSVKGLSRSFSASRRPVGQTDSEKFFLILLDSLEGKEMPEALAATVPRLERLGCSSLTFVMQDGRSFYAYRHCNRYEDYYTLYYCLTRSCVIFASEPLSGLRWHLMGNRELVRASLDGRRPVVERLRAVAPMA